MAGEKISVVIVCKNEAHIIAQTLNSVKSVASEILIFDTGSKDETIAVAKSSGATVVQIPWDGYGKTKQKAVAAANYNWVLNLDADEVLDDEAQKNINELSLKDEKICYRFKYKNFLGKKILKWGEFGFDSHIRLFNRKQVGWDDSLVHEKLQKENGVSEELVKGHILHYTMKNTADFVEKTVRYALTNAENYFKRGRKASWIKKYFSPKFTFVKYYFFRLGFLDGWAGLFSARMAALYTYLKYTRLNELWQENDNTHN